MIKRIPIGALTAALALSACSLASPPSTTPLASSRRALSHGGDAAITFRQLYDFSQDGKPDDGHTPVAGLVALGDALYGTTAYGGATLHACSLGCGTVFRVSPAGKESVLHRFKGGGADGAAPLADLLVVDGSLYGTTSAGGGSRACPGGCGTVFASDDTGKTHLLHGFAGGSDGSEPAAGLVAVNGTLYGTTMFGGDSAHCPMGCGVVFSVSPDGTNEKVIYAFKGGAEGAQPAGDLIFANGELYGTTEYGGRRTPFCATGCGTIFGIAPDGSGETVLHRFGYAPRNADGAYPAAGVTAVGRALYGTTSGGGLGGGTVFSLRFSSNGERTIHVFAPGTNDGVRPDASLIPVGKLLYSTTRNGGTRSGGTVFRVSMAGVERVLYSFTGKPDGAKPQAPLAALAGTLYGTTASGGATSSGTVFSLTP
jgi:uncharacterized repeat protein (TIGR03803 family)